MPDSRPLAPHGDRAARSAAAIAFALLAALALPALAEKADKEKPINYVADHGDVNYQTKVGTLTGNVVVTQGTLTIHADKIVLRQNPDNSLSASAFGNPVTFRQKRDGVDEYYDGFAQRAEYDGTKEFLELFDRALLRRGQDEIRSNYITYNASTEVFKAEGRPPSSSLPADTANPGARVRGVFQPKSDTLPGKAADGAKTSDAGKAAAKDAAKGPTKGGAAPEGTPVTLQPAGDLSPPAK